MPAKNLEQYIGRPLPETPVSPENFRIVRSVVSSEESMLGMGLLLLFQKTGRNLSISELTRSVIGTQHMPLDTFAARGGHVDNKAVPIEDRDFKNMRNRLSTPIAEWAELGLVELYHDQTARRQGPPATYIRVNESVVEPLLGLVGRMATALTDPESPLAGMPLSYVFGEIAATGENRGNEARWKMLMALAGDTTSLTVAHMAKQTGIEEGLVREKARALVDQELISSTGNTEHGARFLYRIANELPDDIVFATPLEEQIFSMIRETPAQTYSLSKIMDGLDVPMRERALRRTLHKLIAKGLLVQQDMGFRTAEDTRTELYVLPDQKRRLSALKTVVYGNADTMAAERLTELFNTPEQVSLLAANRAERGEAATRKEAIRRILTLFPHSTVRDIVHYLRDEHVGVNRVSIYVRELEQENKVQRVSRNGTNFWTIVPQNPVEIWESMASGSLFGIVAYDFENSLKPEPRNVRVLWGVDEQDMATRLSRGELKMGKKDMYHLLGLIHEVIGGGETGREIGMSSLDLQIETAANPSKAPRFTQRKIIIMNGRTCSINADSSLPFITTTGEKRIPYVSSPLFERGIDTLLQAYYATEEFQQSGKLVETPRDIVQRIALEREAVLARRRA